MKTNQVLRPEVLAFALLMEQRLAEKDADKGQRWKSLPVSSLVAHAISKAVELKKVSDAFSIDLSVENRAKIGREHLVKQVVDLANICMFIADVAGVLGLPQEQPEKKYNGVNPNFYDLVEHLNQQQDFSLRTFGPGMCTAGVIDHIKKELKEIEADPSDLIEWVDVVMLGLDGAWRAGYEAEEICQAIHAKLQRNIERTWPDWRTADPGKAIEHIRGEA